MDSNAFRQAIINFYAKQLHFDPTDKAINLPDFSEAAVIRGYFPRHSNIHGSKRHNDMAVGALGVANIMFLWR
ncbi:hypothetical protein OH492_16525 [Vibrio chagasii]|nr:hypothetical protein [Vibrio chagasii]